MKTHPNSPMWGSVPRRFGAAAVWVVVLLVSGSPSWGVEEIVRYHRDEDGRLATAFYMQDTNAAAIHFQYDANGNRLLRVDIATNDASVNADGDDLADLTELYWFGNLRETGSTDPDGDGLVNSNELAAAGHPLRTDTDGDGQSDNEEFIAGTPLDDPSIWFRIEAVVTVAGPATRVEWVGVSGRTYQVQAAEFLGSVWTDVGPPLPVAENGRLGWEYPQASEHRFFRVIVTRP